MFVTRFAPSPTGYLHLGHAFSALTAFDAARSAAGSFILRIEDLDATRCRPEFEAAIMEDLGWLGIDCALPVRRQSDHMHEYAHALDRLIGLGVMYRCFKTRKELLAEIGHAPHGPEMVYRGGPLSAAEEEGKLAENQPFAWRLSLEKGRDYLGPRWDRMRANVDGDMTRIDPSIAGDVVLARKEFPASYHLASVWDDALQGVTHVIRGLDLIEAIHVHVLLQTLLDLPTPHYRHHRLILGADGKRLAKRDLATTLRALREAGVTPAQIRAQLGLTL
jgi:glutamyl-Q tRNA(Asp) synthetase